MLHSLSIKGSTHFEYSLKYNNVPSSCHYVYLDNGSTAVKLSNQVQRCHNYLTSAAAKLISSMSSPFNSSFLLIHQQYTHMVHEYLLYFDVYIT